MTGELFTLTAWTVKPGREDEFVERWTEWADWSAAEGLTAKATLLRDVDQPARFVSFGPWETLEAIRHWRTLPDFQRHVSELREVADRFEPSTLTVVAEH